MFSLHPLLADWFDGRFSGPTEPQQQAWPRIQAGRDVLISAPTGSGKTLAAFLICLDRLVRAGHADGTAAMKPTFVYVSPLKALSNDVQKNLEAPLAEIAALAAERGVALPADPRRRSAPATRRPGSASRCAGSRRTSWSPRPSRCSSC